MKRILIVIIAAVSLSFAANNQWLDKLPAYQKDSYYKQKVYEERDWRGFYSLPEPNQKIDPKNYDFHLLNAAVFYTVNKLREEEGYGELKFSAGLRDAAVVHTSQMVEKNFFDHYNKKEKALYSPDQRIKMFIAKAGFTGETCDNSFIDLKKSYTYLQVADMIVQNLYKSAQHKAILLHKSYNYAGGAVVFEPAEKNNVLYFKSTIDFSGAI